MNQLLGIGSATATTAALQSPYPHPLIRSKCRFVMIARPESHGLHGCNATTTKSPPAPVGIRISASASATCGGWCARVVRRTFVRSCRRLPTCSPATQKRTWHIFLRDREHMDMATATRLPRIMYAADLSTRKLKEYLLPSTCLIRPNKSHKRKVLLPINHTSRPGGAVDHAVRSP